MISQAETQLDLARDLRRQGRLEEALAVSFKALELDERNMNAYASIVRLYDDMGAVEELLKWVEKGLAISPGNVEALGCRAMTLLKLGRLAQGWKDYEIRFQCRGFPLSKPNYSQPQWNGANPYDLTGKTLLVYTEQGFGDTFQFIRYVPLLAARGARVIVKCQHSLRWLIEQVKGVAVAITDTDTPPRFDLHIPLLSLPLAFGTTLESIPADVPYLQADAHRIALWRTKLQALSRPNPQPSESSRPLRVGLCWAGRPQHTNDMRRSLKLQTLSPLASVPNVVFYCLQKGEPGKEARGPSAAIKMQNFTSALYDFGDTAALIANLDLVISADTAPAHLVGALGKPVWTLLPFCAEWRWLLDRKDSPWYPTMKLFRQPRPGDWNSVVARVAEELATLSVSYYKK